MTFPFPFEDLHDVFDADGTAEMRTIPMRYELFDLLQTEQVSPEEAFRLGIYWFLCDAMLDRLAKDGTGEEERYAALWSLVSEVSSRYAPLRYSFYEQHQSLRARQLAGHARDAHHHGLKDWVKPRIEKDIESYTRRIEALRLVLDHHGADADG